MGGCHTLAFTDNQLVGDPIEKQSFDGMKFKQSGDGSRVSSGPGVQIHQIKKYMFESSLKRMSVLCKVTEAGAASHRVLTKGAPEVLKKFIKNPPADYDESYLKYVKNGARVLVLAQKRLHSMSQADF
jgi:cation-transporting ATPase 13A1